MVRLVVGMERSIALTGRHRFDVPCGTGEMVRRPWAALSLLWQD